ncbi:MAG: DUF2007 domain-containing protein [Flavobacteriales bacterium]|nr:DUF2007 domain-containing protein [Flavobacteriales bacterium]
MDYWIKIYTSTDLFKIELLKGFLKENNIIAMSINKKDSSYLAFGDVELYVDSENVMKAKMLIKKQEDEPNS